MTVLPHNLTTLHSRAPVSSPKKIPTRYAVVVDAGSSGSRVQVFSWKDPALLRSKLISSGSANHTIFNSVPEITQDPSLNKKISPGISSYAGKPKLLWKSHLKLLVKHAELGVPKSERPNTPFFVLATAGMRLLPEAQQLEILSETCRLLKENTSFYLPECESHVSIIDGETEALYGWLSLNYLLESFNSYDISTISSKKGKPSTSDSLIPPTVLTYPNSYGFMDMGGASMQVAFSPNSTEAEKHLNDLYTVRLRSMNGENQEWRVFVSSWLGFGANEARRRYAQHLLEIEGYYETPANSKTKVLPQDPCFPTGLTHNMAIDANTTLAFDGNGNFTTCLNSMQPLLRKDQPCEEEPCLFNGIHAPAIDFTVNKFVGVSEYWYTANDIFKLGGSYNFKKFSEHVAAYCGMPWDKLKKQTGPNGAFEGIDQEKLKTACFKATWVISVLHSGFNIPIDEHGKILEIEQSSTPSYFKSKTDPTPSSKIESKSHYNADNQTSINERRSLDDFLSPFQSAARVGDTELTWMLGRALLYASSQVPPATDSTSDVGYLPADTTTKHYVLGGELDGVVPGIASSASGSQSSKHQESSFEHGLLKFFSSIIIFAMIGYALMYAFYAIRHKRHMPWLVTKLRIVSVPMALSRAVVSVKRLVFGESRATNRSRGRFRWSSGGYQRVLEEGGFIESSHSLDSLDGPNTTLSTLNSGPSFPVPEFSVENAPFSSSPLRGKDGSKLVSLSSTTLNRVFSDKNTQPGYTGAQPIHKNGNQSLDGPLVNSLFPNNNKFYIPSSAGAVTGRSTSMIDLSAFQNPVPRPPSRPSSRMSLFNNNNINGTTNGNQLQVPGANNHPLYNYKNNGSNSSVLFGLMEGKPGNGDNSTKHQ